MIRNDQKTSWICCKSRMCMYTYTDVHDCIKYTGQQKRRMSVRDTGPCCLYRHRWWIIVKITATRDGRTRVLGSGGHIHGDLLHFCTVFSAVRLLYTLLYPSGRFDPLFFFSSSFLDIYCVCTNPWKLTRSSFVVSRKNTYPATTITTVIIFPFSDNRDEILPTLPTRRRSHK